MMVYPLDGNHAVIIAGDATYFYSHPLRSTFLHIPSEYPTLAAMERKYRLPRLDEIIDGGPPAENFHYTPGITEVGVFLYGDPIPPYVFREDENGRRFIGLVKVPLEHPVCDTFADSLKLLFGTVSAFTDPENRELVVSFTPDGRGEESLYSLLYYALARRGTLEKIIGLALRVLEWANPRAYSRELDEAYREEIERRLLKIVPVHGVLHYTPLYYVNGELFVEGPRAAREVRADIVDDVKTFLFM